MGKLISDIRRESLIFDRMSCAYWPYAYKKGVYRGLPEEKRSLKDFLFILPTSYPSPPTLSTNINLFLQLIWLREGDV